MAFKWDDEETVVAEMIELMNGRRPGEIWIIWMFERHSNREEEGFEKAWEDVADKTLKELNDKIRLEIEKAVDADKRMKSISDAYKKDVDGLLEYGLTRYEKEMQNMRNCKYNILTYRSWIDDFSKISRPNWMKILLKR